jgi:hypothetical protein
MHGSVQVRWYGLLLAALLVGTVGCSRQAFRSRADQDVEAIITQKNLFPDWQVKNWHVYPDGRARFADPSKPDFPPYPPDDYAAKLVSPNPQRPGRGGVGRYEGDLYLKQIREWDEQNRAEPRENLDEPKAAIAADEKAINSLQSREQAFRIKLEQSLELGLYNSREFQDRREDLYLAALPVSLERFQFSAQAFASDQIIRTWAGVERNDGSTGWANNASIGFRQRFATGGTLLVQLANQIMFNMIDGRPTIAVGNTGLTFIQPLLRGGGFAVTLEALTQAERNMLYAIRSYARFRNVFYYAIAGGGGYTNNPYGLQGLSVNLGRGIGTNLTASPAGYLPVLLRSAVYQNEQGNIAQIESFLRLFQNLKEGGGVTELQVSRVEQRLLQSRAIVLRRSQEYIDSIDNFKLQLGVPATLPLELDDEPIRPLRRQLKRFEEVYQQLRDLEKAAALYDPKEPAGEYRNRWNKLLAESPLAKGTPLAMDWPKVAANLKALPEATLRQRLAEALELRRKLLDEKAARQAKAQAPPDDEAERLNGIEEEIDRLRFEQALRQFETQPWLRLPAERQAGERSQAFRSASDAGLLLAIVARNQRLAEVRKGWPEAPGVVVECADLLKAPLDEAYAKVAEVALKNRLELMNARALVVDAWRQLAVQANSLQGYFDVQYDINAATSANGSQPFQFRPSNTLNQLRLRLEPPFVRRAERNAYRASLITYQRQRRTLQAFEDNIVTDSRTDLRTVRQLYQVYLVQQRAVELAYSQVDNAQSTFLAPPDPKAPDTAGAVAALTQQLLEAQAALVSAQNDLYTAWINYHTARMELYLDLELLSPDERGNWTDDNRNQPGSNPAGPQPERLPPPIPIDVGGLDPFPPLALPAP